MRMRDRRRRARNPDYSWNFPRLKHFGVARRLPTCGPDAVVDRRPLPFVGQVDRFSLYTGPSVPELLRGTVTGALPIDRENA